jgi:hypothetical protein
VIDYDNNKEEWYIDGTLHREDGPAVIYHGQNKEEWFLNGVLHRDDGPAIIENGNEEWYLHGNLHREDDLPAITIYRYMEDTQTYLKLQEWWVNGLKHRENNPAIISGENKEYYINDQLHRVDGPAINLNGEKYWYFFDNNLSETKHKKIVGIWKRYLLNIKKSLLNKYRCKLNLHFNKDISQHISHSIYTHLKL